MREVQLARIIISPISYNPLTNEIEVITKLEVEVNFSVKNKPISIILLLLPKMAMVLILLRLIARL